MSRGASSVMVFTSPGLRRSKGSLRNWAAFFLAIFFFDPHPPAFFLEDTGIYSSEHVAPFLYSGSGCGFGLKAL